MPDVQKGGIQTWRFFITSPLRYADADMTDFPLLRPTIFTVK